MDTAPLGRLGPVSRLTLGGGGIGQIWGETSRDEALATVHAAIDAGIDLLDTAPMYRNCEQFIGEAFGGRLPKGVRITSKCALGTVPHADAEKRIVGSLEASLTAMKLERVDVYFLHTNLCADDYVYAHGNDRRDQAATTWSLYSERVVPTFDRLVRDGRIGAWGITGVGVPVTILAALEHGPRPHVVQVITNLLDSPGGLRRYAEPAQPREIARAAKGAGAGTMGIRAVQAGALTREIDHALPPNYPDAKDYARAAPFRALCERWGEDPAQVAHRYALSMPNVDTVVLGVKNRAELAQCLAAEAAGPFDARALAEIDALGLRA
ncbi:MAG TPA: aldo/keto reductase [Myxococcota bacterium]|nr:aldo/keto reductase [Myxococcota bacterium]